MKNKPYKYNVGNPIRWDYPNEPYRVQTLYVALLYNLISGTGCDNKSILPYTF